MAELRYGTNLIFSEEKYQKHQACQPKIMVVNYNISDNPTIAQQISSG